MSKAVDKAMERFWMKKCEILQKERDALRAELEIAKATIERVNNTASEQLDHEREASAGFKKALHRKVRF